MSVVVGIDPSLTKTGVAALVDGRPVALRGVGHGTPDSKSYAHRSDRIVSQCRAVTGLVADMADHYGRPDLAVIEGPAYGHANAYTHDGAGLWWGLYSTLRARDIPIAVVSPTTRAQWATGRGHAKKPEVLAEVRSWWPNIKILNHDIADACILALMGALHVGDPMPFRLKARHHHGLTVVKWPSIPCAKPDTTQAGAPR